jgi:hypothetical protein
MKRNYVHLDVFADCAFHGNQPGVFTDATGLDAEGLQRIAGEMAFPETTFVFRCRRPVSRYWPAETSGRRSAGVPPSRRTLWPSLAWSRGTCRGRFSDVPSLPLLTGR